MLNLINMFSIRPFPIKGARLVAPLTERQSSDLKASAARAKNAQIEKAKIRRAARKLEILDHLSDRYDNTNHMSITLGFSESNTVELLKELIADGKVIWERRGATKFYTAS